MKNLHQVKASEIGEYIYCQRGWWLRFNEYITGSTPSMDEGIKKHNELSQNIESFSTKKILAISLIILGLILTILTIAFTFI